jgi:hypothetical protein
VPPGPLLSLCVKRKLLLKRRKPANPGGLFSFPVEHLPAADVGFSISPCNGYFLPLSPGRHIAPAGSRRYRHEVALQGVQALFPEAQQRGRVPRVRKEGSGAEVLFREAAFHRAELCETDAGKLILITFACLSFIP